MVDCVLFKGLSGLTLGLYFFYFLAAGFSRGSCHKDPFLAIFVLPLESFLSTVLHFLIEISQPDSGLMRFGAWLEFLLNIFCGLLSPKLVFARLGSLSRDLLLDGCFKFSILL